MSYFKIKLIFTGWDMKIFALSQSQSSFSFLLSYFWLGNLHVLSTFIHLYLTKTVLTRILAGVHHLLNLSLAPSPSEWNMLPPISDHFLLLLFTCDILCVCKCVRCVCVCVCYIYVHAHIYAEILACVVMLEDRG